MIAEVFRKRAVGASWAELARYLEDHKVYPSTGNKHWSTVSVSHLVKNPVYLGQARSGSVVNDQAHEPIVTQAEFDAAQSTKKSLFAQRDGSLASQALLGGLARCAGCGHTLKITGTTYKKTKERARPTTAPAATAAVPAPGKRQRPGSRPLRRADRARILRSDGGPVAEAVRGRRDRRAAAAVTAAEHELDLFVNNPTLLSVLGEAKFVEGVEVRQAELEHAREELARVRTESRLRRRTSRSGAPRYVARTDDRAEAPLDVRATGTCDTPPGRGPRQRSRTSCAAYRDHLSRRPPAERALRPSTARLHAHALYAASDVVNTARSAYVTTKDVRRLPACPQEIAIPQRPGVVFVPTFHVQLTRPAIVAFG